MILALVISYRSYLMSNNKKRIIILNTVLFIIEFYGVFTLQYKDYASQ